MSETQTKTGPALLKLRARDPEDVQVVSAILQDAIVPVVDIFYGGADNSFIMVVHRLRREDADPAEPSPGAADASCGLERICCAVHVQNVAKVQSIGFDETGGMLELLAIMMEQQTLTFVFAAGVKIRLELVDGSMIIEDFGEPWPAQCNPCHDKA